jgi:hypothetical protein
LAYQVICVLANFRRVKELYLDAGNVICIPDDSLPYEKPGFPIYREHAPAPDPKNKEQVKRSKELEAQIKAFESVFAESNLHSMLRCVLHKKVRYFYTQMTGQICLQLDRNLIDIKKLKMCT